MVFGSRYTVKPVSFPFSFDPSRLLVSFSARAKNIILSSQHRRAALSLRRRNPFELIRVKARTVTIQYGAHRHSDLKRRAINTYAGRSPSEKRACLSRRANLLPDQLEQGAGLCAPSDTEFCVLNSKNPFKKPFESNNNYRSV